MVGMYKAPCLFIIILIGFSKEFEVAYNEDVHIYYNKFAFLLNLSKLYEY